MAELRIVASHRRTAWALMLALAALASVAACLIGGFWQTPRGYSYHGYVMLSDDGAQYLAAIRQGAGGFLLYHDQFTTQPASPIFMYPFYMLAGLVLSPLHVAPPVVFGMLHIVAAVGLVYALWVFARTFAPVNAIAAYALILFGGSLALIPIAWTNGRALLPYLTSELGTMQALLLSVHECAGLAAQAGCLVAYRLLCGRWRTVALLTAVVALDCTYPFTVPVVAGAMALDTLWRVIETRRMGRDDVTLLVVITPIAALVPAYYWYVFHDVPYWRASAFLHLDATRPSVLLWTFGPLALLAVPRMRSRSTRLLIIWIAVTAIFMLSRLAQPPRLLAGLWLPLAAMAAETLGRLRRPTARWATVCGLSASGLLMPLFLSSVVAQNPGRFPIFQPLEVDKVGQYLAAHATASDVVLADYEVSNMLVGEAAMRVIAGHGYQTFDYTTAVAEQERYAVASDRERRSIERQYGVTYVVVSRGDRALVARLAHDSRYRRRFADGDYELFALPATGGPAGVATLERRALSGHVAMRRDRARYIAGAPTMAQGEAG